MKKQRVFVAINFPEKVKNQLFSLRERRPDLPAMFTKRDSLHLTLAFLGYLDDEQIIALTTVLKEAASRCEPFDLALDSISYGPSNEKPRMVWARGPALAPLDALKQNMEKLLSESVGGLYTPDSRHFSPHVTLARLKNCHLQKLPEINERFKLSFPVTSFELMESELKRSGAEYRVLESFPLGNF